MNQPPCPAPAELPRLSRRSFVCGATQAAAALALLPSRMLRSAQPTVDPVPTPLAPIGDAKGIHPGRVVWVHDRRILDWAGPGHGHWYEPGHSSQDRAQTMMNRAVTELSGEPTVTRAWERLLEHFHQTHGCSPTGYQHGQRFLIKPNWVGMIWREGMVDPQTYRFVRRHDYMNTSPQLIIALIRQLTNHLGVPEANITVCDTLAYLVHEYYDILHAACPQVQYVDFAGQFGRLKTQPSAVPFHWSCRPDVARGDVLPTCFVEADYQINFANLKAHAATGITLCGKNHFGSLIRWPVESGYYDMHRHSFAKASSLYREQVDLLGHAHLGGKTVLNLIDGLFCGKHPVDPVPRRMSLAPFTGDWAKSLLASQDPIALDSVGFDILHAEYDDYPRRPGVDDYLHEAALAADPPSGTFYDPNHDTPTQRLTSLGVHEHWNNPVAKQYSRNLGTGPGIELLPIEIA